MQEDDVQMRKKERKAKTKGKRQRTGRQETEEKQKESGPRKARGKQQPDDGVSMKQMKEGKKAAKKEKGEDAKRRKCEFLIARAVSYGSRRCDQ
jgi:hypothetical protein